MDSSTDLKLEIKNREVLNSNPNKLSSDKYDIKQVKPYVIYELL